MARLPPLSPSALTERQRQIYEKGWSSRSGNLTGPIRATIMVPDLAEQSSGLSNYLKTQTSLDLRVQRLAILLCAREFTAQYVWNAQKPLALQAGLSPDIVDAIERRIKPKLEREDEAAVYQVVRELLDTHKLRNETYARAVKCFGETGLVELIYVIGFYSLHSMMVNTFEILPLSGATPLSE